jgi:hypothetical protein
MNYCHYFPYLLSDFGEILYVECTHNAVEHLRVS